MTERNRDPIPSDAGLVWGGPVREGATLSDYDAQWRRSPDANGHRYTGVWFESPVEQKPRIKRVLLFSPWSYVPMFYLWACARPGFFAITGYGGTAQQAYDDWKSKQAPKEQACT